MIRTLILFLALVASDPTVQDGYLPPPGWSYLHAYAEMIDLTPNPTTTTTTTAPKPRDSGMGSNVEQWRPLVESYFPADQVATAMCVIRGESGGNPNAENPSSTAAGLWQFLKGTWNDVVPREVTGGSYESGAVFDPVAATRAAAWLWANIGWSQWSAYRRC